MEEEEVDAVVTLCQKVSQDSVGVATLDLICRQSKIQTLNKVPQLGNVICVKSPSKHKHKKDKDKTQVVY